MSVNRTTEYTYNADGNIATITAKMSSPSDDQVTTYTYGTTLADSDIASNQLLRAIVYPDSTGPSDRVEMSYNRQGELVARQDQLGTVHLYEYDGLGRRTQDRVTTLGNGVDATVRRIATTYEVRGMVSTITSYNDAGTGTPGSALNEVAFTYNDFGQLTSDAQQHDGPVTGAALDVQYGDASGAGSSNQIRSTSLTYPNGRVIDYSYGSSGSMDDKLNRLQAIEDGSTTLAAYSHQGMGTVVRVDYTEPQVRLDLWGGTVGTYTGLDRFNRVIDLQWFDYGDSEERVRTKHGYDRNGNRLYRRNEVARAAGASFDELYTYDNLNRLTDAQRGLLNAGNTALSSKTFEQQWNLDQVGNWRHFDQDDDGDNAWDLTQTRDHNKVNEITDIAAPSGQPQWPTPSYNAVGNTTSFPQPNDPTSTYDPTYDAWNRLVKLVDGGNTVAEYAYDGRNFRIVKRTYDAGVLDETRHFYYSSGWQVLEERVEPASSSSSSSSSAGAAGPTVNRQFVWGKRYIDDLVCRDRDTTGNGVLDERLWALQDANYNVTCIVALQGAALERYEYDAYGRPLVLNGNWTERATSSYDWNIRYAGYRYDAECGMYQVRHRVLHPELGRWLQRDPAGYLDGADLYTYAQLSPSTARDSYGLVTWNECCPSFFKCLEKTINLLASALHGLGGALTQLEILVGSTDLVYRAYSNANRANANKSLWELLWGGGEGIKPISAAAVATLATPKVTGIYVQSGVVQRGVKGFKPLSATHKAAAKAALRISVYWPARENLIQSE